MPKHTDGYIKYIYPNIYLNTPMDIWNIPMDICLKYTDGYIKRSFIGCELYDFVMI